MVTDGSHVTCGAHPQQGLQLQSCFQSSQPTGRRLMAGEQQQANPSTSTNPSYGGNSTTNKDGSSAGGGDGEPQPEPAARAASAVASTGNTVTRGYGDQVATGAILLALSRKEACRKDATPQNESRLPGLVTPGMVVSHAAYGEWLQVQLFDALGQCVWGGYDDASLQLQVSAYWGANTAGMYVAAAVANDLQYRVHQRHSVCLQNQLKLACSVLYASCGARFLVACLAGTVTATQRSVC